MGLHTQINPSASQLWLTIQEELFRMDLIWKIHLVQQIASDKCKLSKNIYDPVPEQGKQQTEAETLAHRGLLPAH